MTAACGGLWYAATAHGRWVPGIGDPTALGWVTVAAYAVAAVLCARAAFRESRIDARGVGKAKRTAFWAVLALLMVALGVNKQLDLQSWLTQAGRDIARQQGWYAERRVVQLWFIRGVVAAGAVALAGALWITFRAHRRFRFALTGMFFLFCFIAVRAASFHHVDVFLGLRFAHVRMNHMLELGGIFVTGASALLREAPPGEQLCGGEPVEDPPASDG